MILNQSSMTSQKVPKYETQVSNMRSHPSALPSRVFKGTFLRNTWCKDLEGPHPSYVRRPGLMLARIRLVTFNGLVLEDRAGGRLEKASTSPIEEELVAGPPRTLNKVKLATCHTGGPARAGSRVVVTFFISMKKIRQNTRWRRLILHTRRGEELAWYSSDTFTYWIHSTSSLGMYLKIETKFAVLLPGWELTGK